MLPEMAASADPVDCMFEPLDGGVRDGVKHLSALLKAAERRDSGIMLRSHN